MRTWGQVGIATVVALVAGCSTQGGGEPAHERSGITGRVQLGPRCPVESEGHPCPDEPAPGARVTVTSQDGGSSAAAGDVVARQTTDADGRFRVVVAPGSYVVTADAGLSCELVEARVTPGIYASVDVSCDTGIR